MPDAHGNIKGIALSISDEKWARIFGPQDAFWDRVEKTDTCWLWTGNVSGRGYGQVYHEGRNHTAHRVAYEKTHGVIPDGLQIDHLCRNRRCVNPDHLEIVTPSVNTRRGTSPAAANARKDCCPRGHAYDEDNTYVYRRKGHGQMRYCKACRKPGQVNRDNNSDPR